MTTTNNINIFFDAGIRNESPEIYWGFQCWVDSKISFDDVANTEYSQSAIVHADRGYITKGEKPYWVQQLKMTNNEAEWIALLKTLSWLSRRTFQDSHSINIFGDSKLVIEQIQGNWKVKADNLRPFYSTGISLLKDIKSNVHFEHVSRNTEKQKLVDKFARGAGIE